MPINPQHLSKLRCLKTGSILKPANAQILAHVNTAVASKVLRDELGRIVSDPIQEGLANEDESVLYPIVGGAIQMVREELIPLRQLDDQLKGTDDE